MLIKEEITGVDKKYDNLSYSSPFLTKERIGIILKLIKQFEQKKEYGDQELNDILHYCEKLSLNCRAELERRQKAKLTQNYIQEFGDGSKIIGQREIKNDFPTELIDAYKKDNLVQIKYENDMLFIKVPVTLERSDVRESHNNVARKTNFKTDYFNISTHLYATFKENNLIKIDTPIGVHVFRHGPKDVAILNSIDVANCENGTIIDTIVDCLRTSDNVKCLQYYGHSYVPDDQIYCEFVVFSMKDFNKFNKFLNNKVCKNASTSIT